MTLLYDVVEDQVPQPNGDKPVYQQVARVLSRRGYEVDTLAADMNIRALVAQIEKDKSDVIFNLCESLGGVDQRSINVAALLELLGKPFTGAGSYGLMLANDKALSKKIYSFHGLRYPRFSRMAAGQVEWADDLDFPLFVKPADTDSSVGIDEGSLVTNVKQLMERISYIQTEIGSSVLIEEFIDGREIFVGVLGNEKMEALPIIEWDFSGVENEPKFATAEAKWNRESEAYKAPEVFPEDIPEDVYKAIQAAAVDACKALQIFDYGRVDMRLRQRKGEDGAPDAWEFFIIEVNPNPYLDHKAEVALAAEKNGMSYADLVEHIIELTLKRVGWTPR